MITTYESQNIALSDTGGVGEVTVTAGNAALLVPGLHAVLTGTGLDPVCLVITVINATTGVVSVKPDPDAVPTAPYQGAFSPTVPTYGKGPDLTSFTVAKSSTLRVPQQQIINPVVTFRP